MIQIKKRRRRERKETQEEIEHANYQTQGRIKELVKMHEQKLGQEQEQEFKQGEIEEKDYVVQEHYYHPPSNSQNAIFSSAKNCGILIPVHLKKLLI